MSEDEAKELIKNSLKFSNDDISKLSTFRSMLLDYNTRYNLISKSTENLIWSRHILDSAQLIKCYKMEDGASLVDLGSGAGFPGIVLAIFNKNLKFHVKLYEKSPIKRDFLTNV